MKNVPAVPLFACGWSTVSLTRERVELVEHRAIGNHPGAAVVASCQRIEAYGSEPCACRSPQKWEGAWALQHLAEVAAGLHSVVLGEEQILGQARDAFADASGELRAYGDLAIAAARELRRRTDFNSHAGHLLDRALRLAAIEPAGRLLVLGTGAMARLVAARGRELGFAGVTVAGRTPPRGKAAATWARRFVPLNAIGSLEAVDVVAGCLGSGAPAVALVTLPAVRKLVADLGTPVNFSGESGVPMVTIATLLADEESRPHAVGRRAELRAQLAGFVERRLGQLTTAGASSVGKLRLDVERVRMRELERMRRLHPEVAPETLDVLTRSLVNQIFHAPSERLRQLDDEALGQRLVALFADGAPGA
jgi:glutamyl-tRNA reductase